MRRAPDSTDLWASDSGGPDRWVPDSSTPDKWAPDSDGRLTLGRAIELYLLAKAAEGVSPRTTEWYGMILARTARAIGAGRPVDSPTAPELRAYLLGLRETLSASSIAGYVRALKAFGNWLAAEELSPATGLRALRRPKVPVKIIEPVADEELRRLLAAATVRDRAILLLLLDTGLRVSELAGVTLRDLRPDGTLKVMGKGSRERIVPVGATARKAIIRYLAIRGPGDPEAPLFLSRGDGGLGVRGIAQALRRLKTRLGITNRCSPHSFRHTFARSYLVNGGDLFTLQRILGHSTLDMVKRYVARADIDVMARHAVASPADRLAGRR